MREDSTIGDQRIEGDGPLLSIELNEVRRALRRRYWVLIVTTLVVAGIFLGVSMRKKKVYHAIATVVLEHTTPNILGDKFDVDGLEVRGPSQDRFFNTQYQVMKSREVVREAVGQLKLTDDVAFLADYGIGATLDEEAKLKRIEGVINRVYEIVPDRRTNIVALRVEDFDHERAVRIVNKIGKVYIDQQLKGRLKRTEKASDSLEKRLQEYRRKLDASEKALHEFLKNNTLATIPIENRKRSILTELESINNQLIATRGKLTTLKAEREVLIKVRESGDADLASLPRVRSNETVRTLRATLGQLERKRAELGSRYGERHPNMLAVQNQVDRIKGTLSKEVKLIAETLNNEIASLEKTQTALRMSRRGVETRASTENDLAEDYDRLSRDLGNTRKTYEDLLKRRTDTELSSRLESNFVDWHEQAEPIPYAIRPSVSLNTALGAFLGLLLGLLLVLGEILLDNTVHSQTDIEERMRQVFLGLLPGIQHEDPATTGSNIRDRDLFILDNPSSSVAECARSIRTNLLFLSTEKPLDRVLVTSAGPSEGKSTAIVALGTTMALAGNRVLVVDTDLRRPRLHKTFGVSSEVGLTSVLLDSGELDVAIKSTDVSGLDVLPCGPLPPNPAELLHGETFSNLLELLDGKYDRILLDSPPVHSVTDPIILSKLSDGTIIVVKEGKTTKDAARRAVRKLQDVDARILGVILNEVDLREESFYYYYQYRYGTDAKKPA